MYNNELKNFLLIPLISADTTKTGCIKDKGMKHHEYQKTFGRMECAADQNRLSAYRKTGRDPGGKDCSVDLPSYSEELAGEVKKISL